MRAPSSSLGGYPAPGSSSSSRDALIASSSSALAGSSRLEWDRAGTVGNNTGRSGRDSRYGGAAGSDRAAPGHVTSSSSYGHLHGSSVDSLHANPSGSAAGVSRAGGGGDAMYVDPYALNPSSAASASRDSLSRRLSARDPYARDDPRYPPRM